MKTKNSVICDLKYNYNNIYKLLNIIPISIYFILAIFYHYTVIICLVKRFPSEWTALLSAMVEGEENKFI